MGWIFLRIDWNFFPPKRHNCELGDILVVNFPQIQLQSILTFGDELGRGDPQFVSQWDKLDEILPHACHQILPISMIIMIIICIHDYIRNMG